MEKDKISFCERKQPFLKQTQKKKNDHHQSECIKKKMTITKYKKQGGDNYHKVQWSRRKR